MYYVCVCMQHISYLAVASFQSGHGELVAVEVNPDQERVDVLDCTSRKSH